MVLALQNSLPSRCVCAHRVSVCQCFTALSTSLSAICRFLTADCLRTGESCRQFQAVSDVPSGLVSMSATLSGIVSSKSIVPSPVYIRWTCLTVRPAFERYLKLRKIFHNSKSADSFNCFYFDAVTTWEPWDNDRHTEKIAFVILTVISRHRFVAVFWIRQSPFRAWQAVAGDITSQADGINLPIGRLKRTTIYPTKERFKMFSNESIFFDWFGSCWNLSELGLLFSAKITPVFHSRQIFSAGYTSRLYIYIRIYNLYSDAAPIICPTKIIPPDRNLQIIPGMVPIIPFWVPSFPFWIIPKYAYITVR